MREHNTNALELARFLEDRPEITRVYYPGLASFPQHQLAKELLVGHSGMISFEVQGGDKKAHELMDHLRIPKQATSLGGVESLISLPYNTSQASLTNNQKKAIGIEDGLMRLSVGIEDLEDLKNDFKQAFSHIYN
jgi:cystathionine beta-lyase/cystathionine gamma-synthase